MTSSEGPRKSGPRGNLKVVRPGDPIDRTKPKSLTLAAEAALTELLRDLSLGRNEIARRAGVSQSTVTRYAERVGRTFDRSLTEAAAMALKADGRARRLELANALIEDAHREREIFAALPTETAGSERVNYARTISTLAKTVVELDAAERERTRVQSEERSGSDIDDYLKHMLGDESAAG